MDINLNEKERLYQWACEHGTSKQKERYFTKIDKMCASYFEKIHRSEYCREYNFQTLPELRSELDAMWEGDDVMKEIEKPVLVASMKNKPKMKEQSGYNNRKEKREQLKPFIYNF